MRGISFCSVVKINAGTHERAIITLGNQKWNGAMPALVINADIIIIVEMVVRYLDGKQVEALAEEVLEDKEEVLEEVPDNAIPRLKEFVMVAAEAQLLALLYIVMVKGMRMEGDTHMDTLTLMDQDHPLVVELLLLLVHHLPHHHLQLAVEM